MRDPTGHTPGRGAYVCSGEACFELAAQRGRIGRALRAEVGTVQIERLRQE